MIGPLALHRVQNAGIAFGLFSSATAVVIVLTTIAVAWMLIYFARSAARHGRGYRDRQAGGVQFADHRGHGRRSKCGTARKVRA